jgi:hypothetical protein
MFFFKDKRLHALDLIKQNTESMGVQTVYPVLQKLDKIDPSTFGMVLVDLKLPEAL